MLGTLIVQACVQVRSLFEHMLWLLQTAPLQRVFWNAASVKVGVLLAALLVRAAVQRCED
jgi:hypothetical protein